MIGLSFYLKTKMNKTFKITFLKMVYFYNLFKTRLVDGAEKGPNRDCMTSNLRLPMI